MSAVSQSRGATVRNALLAACVAFAPCLFAPAVQAAPIEWRKPVFFYVAQDKRLAEVLQEFAASQNITAVADKAIDEKVSVSFKHHPDEVLRMLTSAYGLIWYYDGRILYFDKAGAAQTRVLRLQHISTSRLRASVRRMGLEDPRYPLAMDDAEATVMVSGPPRYVDTVARAIATLDWGRAAAGAEEVRVFPLRFAWAQDKTIQTADGAVTLPGVATLMKRLFQGQGGGAGRRDSAGPLGAQRTRALTQGQAVESPVAGRMEVPPPMDEVVRQYRTERDGVLEGGDGRLPQIEADGQMNAVVVRDLGYRMDGYTRLIETLDVKPARVEIEVQIIDVEVRSRERLGVSWQSFNSSSGLGLSSAGGGDAGMGMLGGTISSVVSKGHTLLLSNVEALVQEGKARIVAQPRVLTLNNVEANLSNTETYYVKVAGTHSAELFNVTSGLRMRVTPLLSVDEMGSRVVKLAVTAQDGGFANTSVEALPVVKTRDIQTQAVVREDESLLIGGMVYETDSSTLTGVPGLSKIPLLGVLFRHTEQTKVKMERLFLITPKVIEY